MLADVTTEQARAIVAAMRRVATVDGARPLTDVDRVALVSAWHYLFRQTGDVSLDALPDVDPSALGDALGIDADYLRDLASSAKGKLQAVLSDYEHDAAG